MSNNLRLKAANGSEIPYIGWVDIQFDLETQGGPDYRCQIPILVTEEDILEPIIGFNVIREIVRNSQSLPGICQALVTSFQEHKQAIPKLVNLLKADIPSDVCYVRVGRQHELVPARKSHLLDIRVRPGPVREETTVLFEPDRHMGWPAGLELEACLVQLSSGSSCRIQLPIYNHSGKDITLPRYTPLGRLEQIRTILPENISEDEDEKKAPKVKVSAVSTKKSRRRTRHPTSAS